jgi:hypothetical protein
MFGPDKDEVNNLGYYITTKFIVRFQVLRATSMKMVVFWDIALCSLVNIDRQ